MSRKSTPKKQEKFLTQIRKKISAQRKIFGILLVTIAAICGLALGVLLLSRLNTSQSIAKYLPADKTIAILNIGSDFKDKASQDFFALMKNHSVYNEDAIKKFIGDMLHRDFDTEITPWLGSNAAVAVLQNNKSWTTLLFIEVKSRNGAVSFLKKLTLKDDEIQTKDGTGIDVYTFKISQNFVFSFVGNYLVIAKNIEEISLIGQVISGKQQSLFLKEKYHRIADNLPSRFLASGYIDMSALLQTLVSDQNYMREKGLSLLSLQPLLQKIESFGFIVNTTNKNMVVQTLLKFDQKSVKEKPIMNFDKKYSPTLAKFFSKDVKIFFGGLDLGGQIQSIIDVMGNNDEKMKLLFDTGLALQKNTYFGEQVSIKEDIEPLLSGEYACSVTPDIVPKFSCALQLNDPVQDAIRFQKILGGLKSAKWLSQPSIREFMLPDGNIGKQVMTDAVSFSETTKKYNNADIKILAMPEKNITVYSAILGDVLFISNTESEIMTAVDGGKNTKNSFVDANIYTSLIQGVIKNSDEVIYLDMDIVNSWIQIPKTLMPFIEPFKGFASGKNYFDDGISTIHYFSIR